MSEADHTSQEPPEPTPIDPQLVDEQLSQLIGQLDGLSADLTELLLVQAEARVQSVTLVPIELDSDTAFDIARRRRRDWMNARAALVDVWRKIEVVANDLESDLDVVFSGDISTKDNNPVRFRGTTGRLQIGRAHV